MEEMTEKTIIDNVEVLDADGEEIGEIKEDKLGVLLAAVGEEVGDGSVGLGGCAADAFDEDFVGHWVNSFHRR